ncbi:activating signal cointegrator 1 complex subunit 1 [Phlebotomus papatasi]|uniref:activating signal cointegrator 1 complex subunit 1 n=1 Tax=Phlebotomus papatasi TaxID=29031 RepID=UPI002483F4C1|nr:activating signal cointegrator 1 complex subunit 1 [Phlebotomus papatasi]
MDVLSPELLWVDNRCYRVNSTLYSEENPPSRKQGGYIEADLESEDEETMDYEIESTGTDTFRTTFHVPAAFHGSIIGQKGAVRKRLEMETKSLINVPERGSKAPIVVTGRKEGDVIAARKKIEDIVASSRRRNDITHFLSIPCNSEEIKTAFGRFKEALFSGPPIEGLTEDMMQVPEKLHLTLTTMVLMDDQERKLAKNILHDEEDNIKAILAEFGGKAEVQIEGLDSMTDDPQATKVLYAKVQSEALQRIADHFECVYGKLRLGKEQKRSSVKLHMTVISSRFADFEAEKAGNHKKTQPFNATKIFEDFKDFAFGKVPLTEVHLSQRGTYDDRGYYKATSVLHL